MTGETDRLPELPQRFEHVSATPYAGLFKAVGTILLAGTIIGFFALEPIFSIEIKQPWPYLIILPIFIAIVLLSKAKHARSVANVTVDEAGLILERSGKTVEIPWSAMRWAEQNQADGGYLCFYDQEMKLVERVPKTIDRFELLCRLVQQRLDQRPVEDIADGLEQSVKGYGRKQMWFGGVLTSLGIGLLILGWIMPRELPRLNKHGEYNWAEIVELYRHPESQSPKLTYQLIIEDQIGPVEDVVMEEEAWHELKNLFDNEGERYVEVIYLPDDISISFANGQAMPATHYPVWFVYFKAGFALLIGLSTLAAGYANRNARDRIVQHLNDQRDHSTG